MTTEYDDHANPLSLGNTATTNVRGNTLYRKDLNLSVENGCQKNGSLGTE